MKKRVIALVVVTAVWVLVMAVVMKLFHIRGALPWWSLFSLAVLWGVVIDSTKKPLKKDEVSTKPEE